MPLFKIDATVFLRHGDMCFGCPFLEYAGGGLSECTATRNRWESKDFKRQEWCPLEKVEVSE